MGFATLHLQARERKRNLGPARKTSKEQKHQWGSIDGKPRTCQNPGKAQKKRENHKWLSQLITVICCENSLSLPWNTEHGSLSVNFHPIMFPNGFLSWCLLAHSVKTCRLGEITPHGFDFAAAPVIRIVEPQKKREFKSRKRVENKSLQHFVIRGNPFLSLACVFFI